jgi:hypothetical protein
MNNGILLKTVYAALFNLLSNVTLPTALFPPNYSGPFTWNYTTRNMLDWDKVPAADQPAMVLVGGALLESERFAMAAPDYTLKAYCWVYFRKQSGIDPQPYIEDTIFDVFNVLDNAIAGPTPGDRQTLGGTIYWAHCDGMGWEQGIEDNQCVMVLAITMRTGL